MLTCNLISLVCNAEIQIEGIEWNQITIISRHHIRASGKSSIKIIWTFQTSLYRPVRKATLGLVIRRYRSTQWVLLSLLPSITPAWDCLKVALLTLIRYPYLSVGLMVFNRIKNIIYVIVYSPTVSKYHSNEAPLLFPHPPVCSVDTVSIDPTCSKYRGSYSRLSCRTSNWQISMLTYLPRLVIDLDDICW